MQQKIIQVGNKKLLVLDMPEGMNKAEIINGNLVYSNGKSGAALMYHNPNIMVVGFKTDLTETQWAEIVPLDGFIATLTTSTEQGISILKANDCNYNNALIIEIL